jgi:hypothetical protein
MNVKQICDHIFYPGMDKMKPYYFAIEAVNEKGTSQWVRAEAL